MWCYCKLIKYFTKSGSPFYDATHIFNKGQFYSECLKIKHKDLIQCLQGCFFTYNKLNAVYISFPKILH